MDVYGRYNMVYESTFTSLAGGDNTSRQTGQVKEAHNKFLRTVDYYLTKDGVAWLVLTDVGVTYGNGDSMWSYMLHELSYDLIHGDMGL